MFKLAQKIIHQILIWVTPIVFVLSSWILALGDSRIYKVSLDSTDFYSRFSLQLKSIETPDDLTNSGFGVVVWLAAIQDLSSPAFLKGLFETNIDIFTAWLNSSDQTDLKVYLPAKEVELAVVKNLDDKVLEITDSESQINICNPEQAEKVKREGFDEETAFCIPESVVSGSQSITEFLNIDNQSIEQGRVFDQIFQTNTISSFRSNFDISELGIYKEFQSQLISTLNNFRNYYQIIRTWIVVALGILFGLFIADIVMAKMSGYKPGMVGRQFLIISSTSILSLTATLMLIFGGSMYLTSWASQSLIPGLKFATGFQTLIAFETLKLSFAFSIWAVGAAILMLIGYVIWRFASKSSIEQKAESKNLKLNNLDTYTKAEPVKLDSNIYPNQATTLDTAFQEAREYRSYPNNSDISTGFSPSPIPDPIPANQDPELTESYPPADIHPSGIPSSDFESDFENEVEGVGTTQINAADRLSKLHDMVQNNQNPSSTTDNKNLNFNINTRTNPNQQPPASPKSSEFYNE